MTYRCPICRSDNGCRPLRGKLANLDYLTAADWWQVYWFLRSVQLPFIHRLMAEAQKRSKADD